jgi:hypothetical protein
MNKGYHLIDSEGYSYRIHNRTLFMKNPLLILLTWTLVIAGCATSENYGKRLDTWMGSKESSLVAIWGTPDSFYEADGIRYLTYRSNNSGYVAGIPPRTSTTYINGKAYTNTVGGTQGYIYNKSCSTTFTVTNGIITNWKFKGNDCTATAPD